MLLYYRTISIKISPVTAIFIAIPVVFITITLFSNWETSGEGWSYWFFARVFSETGDFIANDRSPIYTLYLNAFRWLGYPNSVTVEYIFTSIFAISGITIFSSLFLPTRISIFVALLWLPYLQFAEPVVQQIALSFSLWGLFFRKTKKGQISIVLSYSSFLLAYMFRSSYIVFLFIFLVWDIYRTYINRHTFNLYRKSIQTKLNISLLIPLVAIIGMFLWFSFNQSNHPWNNPQAGTNTWFPTKDSKSLTDAHFMQAWNWRYIDTTYGTFLNHDWYFTNQELFNDADNVRSAFKENPGFIIKLALSNIKPTITTISKFTEFRYLPFLRIWDAGLFLLIVLAIWFASKGADLKIFTLSSVIIIAVSALALPGTRRHFVSLVPILILSACWYGNLASNLLYLKPSRIKDILGWAGFSIIFLSLIYYLLRSTFLPQTGFRTLYAMLVGLSLSLPLIIIWSYRPISRFKQVTQLLWSRYLIAGILIILFSSGISTWSGIFGDILSDYKTSDMDILRNQEEATSMKSSFQDIENIIADCHGIMSLESTFIAAFMDIPIKYVYDIWEIPPFGEHGKITDYDGLRPDRINCLLISDHLVRSIGKATNSQLRYDNYILPYANKLKQMGATIYEIRNYGQAVILNKES